jgi:TPP-dependent pyruvate/acetoin dehydrogenase alpha subunit
MAPQEVYRCCTHRQQPLIAKTIGLKPFLGELMNKRTGLLKGTSGEYHLVSLKDRLLPICGILGDQLLSSTGYAWTLKADKKANTVVLHSIGDGAMSEGCTYEGINMAAILKLPILYVIENNQVAMTTPLADEAPITDLYRRAESAGLRGAGVDGNNVEAVVEAVLAGLSQVSKNEPMLLELKTWRWEGHYVGDDQSRYRDASFRNNTNDIDPVYLYEQVLKERGVIDDKGIEKVHAEQSKLLSDAFAEAAAQEYPTKEECLVYSNLYASPTGGEV